MSEPSDFKHNLPPQVGCTCDLTSITHLPGADSVRVQALQPPPPGMLQGREPHTQDRVTPVQNPWVSLLKAHFLCFPKVCLPLTDLFCLK